MNVTCTMSEGPEMHILACLSKLVRCKKKLQNELKIRIPCKYLDLRIMHIMSSKILLYEILLKGFRGYMLAIT